MCAPADYFPDIVAEGKRLIDKSNVVLIDVNPALILSTTNFKTSDLKPVFSGLTPSDQDELKTVLSSSPAKGEIEKISGFAASLLLIGEGQHGFGPEIPSIGLALAKSTQKHEMRQEYSNMKLGNRDSRSPRLHQLAREIPAGLEASLLPEKMITANISTPAKAMSEEMATIGSTAVFPESSR